MNPGDPEPEECDDLMEPLQDFPPPPDPENMESLQDFPPPPDPENPSLKSKQRVKATAKLPQRCERVLYENRLEVPREIRLKDLIKKRGVRVRVAADKPSSGKVKIEITGRRARQYRIYRKRSRKADKVLARARVTMGSGYKTVTLKAILTLFTGPSISVSPPSNRRTASKGCCAISD